MTQVAVLGAGSWGTALANLLARKGTPTVLWAYEEEVAREINASGRNPTYLREIQLDPRLRATTSLEDALAGASAVVSVSPSHVVRTVMCQAAPHIQPGTLLVSASKGIENDTLLTMDEVLLGLLGPEHARYLAYLSGPSFALEVGLGYPTAVTIASHRAATALWAQELFQGPSFRVYTSSDVRGVELGGALKNVIAIAAGVAEGMGYGHNTSAALITRGLAEMTRLGSALGAEPMTFSGLTGMGDLILTCTGALSRNRSVGVELGKGRPIAEILSGMNMVAEGVRTAKSTYDLAKRHRVDMPIVQEVYAMLYEGRSARDALERLMSRSPRPEVG